MHAYIMKKNFMLLFTIAFILIIHFLAV